MFNQLHAVSGSPWFMTTYSVNVGKHTDYSCALFTYNRFREECHLSQHTGTMPTSLEADEGL